MIFSLKNAIDQNDVDNNPIQNCVCTLRNLAFRIQEVEDPDFATKRKATLQRQKKQEKGGKKEEIIFIYECHFIIIGDSLVIDC